MKLVDVLRSDRISWLISAYTSDPQPDALALDIARSQPRLSLPPTQHEHDQPSPPPPPPPRQDIIHRLMHHPTLFDPIRAPRYPIVLCHGLYGFDVKGPAAFPSLRLHYWSSVLSILKHKLGAEVIVTGVPATGSIASRGECLNRILEQKARGRGINLMAHSMGGLDCRHLITHVRPTEYVPLSLTSISTPHRGSPFMDWCAQYLGLGRRQDDPRADDAEPPHIPSDSAQTPSTDASEKRDTAFRLSLSTLPSSFTTLLLSLVDSPAYANLTTSYLNDVFNPATPDDPRVKYFSVASRIDDMHIWHPLWFPKMVLDDAERKARGRLKEAPDGDTPYGGTSVLPWARDDAWGNDGLVTIQSARWGEFLGILDGCDHWEIRGARRMELVNGELLPSGIGSLAHRVAGESWDWSRLAGAWRKQAKGSQELELTQATAPGALSSSSPDIEDAERITPDGPNDPVIKASTDKLSAVFDWIVEHVPSSPLKEDKKPANSDPTNRFDLERFYVALTRKLYDEGL